MRTLLILIWVCCASIVKAQQTSIRFNQLDSLQRIKPKKVFVFIHTNWCNYCKTMDEVTFKDKAVAKLLSEAYYFVKLDAEEKLPISYQHQRFEYKANKGFHELAIALGNNNGKLVFPTSCILNNQNEILFQHHEMMNAKELLKVLDYYAVKN
jgi:thioredoxin-related protein